MTETAPTPISEPAPPASRARRRDPDSEAAGRRVELREAEAKRDTLAEKIGGQVDTLRRQQVEHHLSTMTIPEGQTEARTLHRPADLWEALGAEPGQFFTDDTLDPDALAAFISEMTEGRTHLVRTIEGYRPPQNTIADAARAMGAGPRGVRSVGTDSPWADVLKHR